MVRESPSRGCRGNCPEHANQLALAVLLVLGKMLGFGFAVALWPGPVGPSALESEALSRGAEAPHAKGAEVPHAPAVPLADEAAHNENFQVPTDLSALENPEKVSRGQVAREAADLDRARRLRAVRTFIALEMVRVVKAEDGLSADEVFRAYSAWAREHMPNSDMTQAAFARICADLNVAKQRDRNVIRYALRPAGEVPALAEVA